MPGPNPGEGMVQTGGTRRLSLTVSMGVLNKGNCPVGQVYPSGSGTYEAAVIKRRGTGKPWKYPSSSEACDRQQRRGRVDAVGA